MPEKPVLAPVGLGCGDKQAQCSACGKVIPNQIADGHSIVQGHVGQFRMLIPWTPGPDGAGVLCSRCYQKNWRTNRQRMGTEDKDAAAEKVPREPYVCLCGMSFQSSQLKAQLAAKFMNTLVALARVQLAQLLQTTRLLGQIDVVHYASLAKMVATASDETLIAEVAHLILPFALKPLVPCNASVCATPLVGSPQSKCSKDECPAVPPVQPQLPELSPITQPLPPAAVRGVSLPPIQ